MREEPRRKSQVLMTLVQPPDPAMPEVLTLNISVIKIPFLFKSVCFILSVSWNQKLSSGYRRTRIYSRIGWSWVQGGPKALVQP